MEEMGESKRARRHAAKGGAVLAATRASMKPLSAFLNLFAMFVAISL
jgi:hypothetical protein